MRRLSHSGAMSEARRFKTLTLSRATGSAVPGSVPQATAQNQMIIASATPAWTLLTAPAAEGQALITGADPYTPAWGTTFPTVIQFDAGLTFGGATGANIITVPDNVAQAMHIVDAGATEYLRIVSTDTKPIIEFHTVSHFIDSIELNADTYIKAYDSNTDLHNIMHVNDAVVTINAPTVAPSEGQLDLNADGIACLRVTSCSVIVNEGGTDMDFRVEASGQANALFVQGSTGNIGSKTNDPLADWHVVSSAVANKDLVDSSYRTQILEDPNLGLQLIGTDASTGMVHIILTGAPASGDNKHWIISHLGVAADNRFSIGYKTSNADGFTPHNPTEHFVILTTGETGLGTVPTEGIRLHILHPTDHTFVKVESNTNDKQAVYLADRHNANNWAGLGLQTAGSGKWLIGLDGATENLQFYDDVNNAVAVVFEIGGNVSIGTVSPATSALLELASTTGALLLTRMTTTQRDALTAVNGMVIYNSTTNAFNFYENGSWATK